MVIRLSRAADSLDPETGAHVLGMAHSPNSSPPAWGLVRTPLRGLVGNFNARRIEDLARELEHQDTGSDMFKAGIVYSKLVSEIGAMNTAQKNLLEQSASA